MSEKLLFISTFALLLMVCSACGSGGLFESSTAREKRELCASTGGVASKDAGCGESYDNGVKCKAEPECEDAVYRGRSKAILCECAPGKLYDEDEGCQPHPDPICAHAENTAAYEDHLRSIIDDNSQDCGRQNYGAPIDADIRSCMVEAQAAKTPAIAVFEDDEIFLLRAVDSEGASLEVTYNTHQDEPEIIRWRCFSPAPLEDESQQSFEYSVFACQDSYRDRLD